MDNKGRELYIMIDQILTSRPRITLPIVTTAPTGTAKAGEVVIYDNGSTRRLYMYISSAWHYITIT